MIVICESCRGFMQVLRPEDLRGSHGGYQVVCQVCKLEIPVADFPGGKLVCSYYPKLKEVSEVLSSDSDVGRDQTDATCPKCNHKRAYYTEMQTRSADEAATIFYKCMGCGNQWREN
ncbi:hypothetical protein RvY_10047 [Ramazzottius varieornatus]|uniref:DNA-directed RNA polymerase subunit n=1 Tax=Ramazzottius varieornatus TaxID=947166 RepID=A0A1D1VBE9_RAMVA|nr:hypothetical protein RvY_10047 [Ramazzottius varieornatus]